jgi:XRE family transcriptional regulator, regulator of sulfur utilization
MRRRKCLNTTKFGEKCGLTLCLAAAAAQKPPVMQSAIFDWKAIPATQIDIGARLQVFQAPTAALDEFECHVATVNIGATSHAPHPHHDEELVIMKACMP